MTCKECSYFKGGFCTNQDTIVDPEDRICIGYEPRKESIKCNAYDKEEEEES